MSSTLRPHDLSTITGDSFRGTGSTRLCPLRTIAISKLELLILPPIACKPDIEQDASKAPQAS